MLCTIFFLNFFWGGGGWGGGNFPCISVWSTLVNLICIIMGICALYVFLLSCKAL